MVSPEKDLICAVEHAIAALLNAPKAGEQFDSQHAETYMNAYLALQGALTRLRAGEGDSRFVQQLQAMPLVDALWWFIENGSDDVRAKGYFYLRGRIHRYWIDSEPERAREREFRLAKVRDIRKKDVLPNQSNGRQ